MAAQKGKELVLKIGDAASPEGFTTVGGLRTNSITLNEEPVDVTNKSSSGQFRQLLRAGIKTVATAGSGVFTDSAAEESVRGSFFGSTISNWQIVVPGLGTFEGAFLITTLEYAGEYNGEVTYNLSLESAGAVTFE